MDTYVGEMQTAAEEYRATKAVIVYESRRGGNAYASVHPVIAARAGARPKLGVGSPVTDVFVRELVKGLGQEVKTEYLDADVLYSTPEILVWWTPAQLRDMRFSAGSELAPASGVRLPIPPLVWRLTAGELAIRALADDDRPRPDTALQVAPLWNTSPGDGVVCEGSMRRPGSRGTDSREAWMDGFFGSEFTHQAGAGALATRPGYVPLLLDLAARAKKDGEAVLTYPSGTLVRASDWSGKRQTLSSWVAAGGRP